MTCDGLQTLRGSQLDGLRGNRADGLEADYCEAGKLIEEATDFVEAMCEIYRECHTSHPAQCIDVEHCTRFCHDPLMRI